MKKIIISVLVGLATMLFVSCDKDFELQRPNQSPWQSADELELAVQAPYLMITERPWANALGMMDLSGFGESDIAMYLDGMTGDSYYYAYNQRMFTTLSLSNFKELEGGFTYLYAASTTINAALQLIMDAEEKMVDPFPGMTEADRQKVKELKGELLFQRALVYWYLVRKFAPPYNDANKSGKYIVMARTYINSAEEIKNGKLASVEEIYNAILEDLDSAVKLLPTEYPDDTGSARMRANKNVAKALKARILFYMGAQNNAAAIKSLITDIVGSGMYNLSESPYSAFGQIGNGYGKETIWQICYDSASQRFDRNPSVMGYYSYNTGVYSPGVPKACGWIAFAMSFNALQRVGWADASCHVTAAAEGDLRYKQLYIKCTDATTAYYQAAQKMPGKPDLVFLWKFFRGATPEAPAQRRANRPIIRLADMLLLRAEVSLLSGDAPGALQDVNAVRTRAGLPALTTVTENDIELEYIKEMAGENASRMNWLVGLHKDIPIGNRDASKYQPIKYPYSDMYYNVPILEQQTNTAYQKN